MQKKLNLTNKQLSVLAIIISSFCFALMAVFVKFAGDISSPQKAIFRSGVTTIVGLYMFKKSNLKFRNIKSFKWLNLRSIFGTCGIVLNYYAVDHLVLSDSTILLKLSTIFLLITSFLFLKEKLAPFQILAIIVAFIGVIFVVKPAFNFSILPYAIGILGAFCAALAYTCLRPLGKLEHPNTIVMYFSVFTTLVLLPYVIYNWQNMSISQTIYCIIAGICAYGGQVGLTVGYKLAPAKEVSIYSYSGVIFTAIFSLILFDVLPDALSIIGYIIIFASSFYLYRKNLS